MVSDREGRGIYLGKLASLRSVSLSIFYDIAYLIELL